MNIQWTILKTSAFIGEYQVIIDRKMNYCGVTVNKLVNGEYQWYDEFTKPTVLSAQETVEKYMEGHGIL